MSTYGTRSGSRRNPRDQDEHSGRGGDPDDEGSSSDGGEISPVDDPIAGPSGQGRNDTDIESDTEEDPADRTAARAARRTNVRKIVPYTILTGHQLPHDMVKWLKDITDRMSGGYALKVIESALTDELLTDCLYQGFNVNATREKIVRALLILTNNRRMDMHRAIVKLLALYLLRGNNTVAMLKTMGPIAEREMTRLIRAIPVVPKLDRNQIKDCVTLARISLCFPELAFEVAARVESQNVTNLPIFDDGFPSMMRVNSFPAMIDLEEPDSLTNLLLTKLFNAHVYYQAHASCIYSREKLKVNKEILLKQMEYARTTNRQSVVDRKRRSTFVLNTQYGLYTPGPRNPDGTDSFVLPPKVEAAANEFAAIMQAT